MRDRLEMSFSRPSLGGGEVKDVEYDKVTGTGQITFLHTGGRRECVWGVVARWGWGGGGVGGGLS